jgi:hypothetical protein
MVERERWLPDDRPHPKRLGVMGRMVRLGPGGDDDDHRTWEF